jgi:hypothetical protein
MFIPDAITDKNVNVVLFVIITSVLYHKKCKIVMQLPLFFIVLTCIRIPDFKTKNITTLFFLFEHSLKKFHIRNVRFQIDHMQTHTHTHTHK